MGDGTKNGVELDLDRSDCAPCDTESDVGNDASPGLIEGNDKVLARKSRKVMVLIWALAFVAVAAIAVFTCMRLADGGSSPSQSPQNAQDESEVQEFPIALTVNAEGYAAESSSPIVLRVEGTDARSQAVSKECLFGGKSDLGLSLPCGSYTISVASSPITDEGVMFDVSNASIRVEVEGCAEQGEPTSSEASEQKGASNGEAGAALSESGEEASVVELSYEISLVPLDPRDVSSDQIDADRSALIAAGLSEEEAQGYREAAEKKVGRSQADDSESSASQHAQAKSDFEADLQNLRSEYQVAAGSAQTQQEMNRAAAEYYQKFDALLSEVYGYLLDTLPEGQSAELAAAQDGWVSARESEMYAAQSQSFGGTMSSLDRHTKGIELTQARIAELVTMIA